MANTNYLSKDAIEALKNELHDLKYVKRPAASKAIETARGHGDLSENAEYHSAKEEQALLERRITQLEETLATARPLEEIDIPADICYLGARISLRDLDDDSEEEYTLVAPPEADPRKGRLSVESPIGRGLLGHKAGDEVEIQIPAGTVRYRVEHVTR